jgi:beta-barrel assembly-enhancing protease
MSQYGYGGSNQNSGGLNLRVLMGIGIAIFGIISFFLHTSTNPTTGEVQHVSMTPDQETQLGLASAPEMAQQMGGEVGSTDPETQLVQRVGQYVHDHSTAAKSPYTYQYHLLADRQTINAFALPGGQVFITKGLLDKLSDTAELAGVLGHETGHVVERHSAQQMEKQKLGQALVTATAVGSRNGYQNGAMAQMVNQLVQLHYSRDDESQADARGLQYMTESGFDPRAMIDVMKILQSVSGARGSPEFLQTHPDPGNRIQAIQQWLEDHPDRAANLTRGERIHHE